MLGPALARGARSLRSTLVEPEPWLADFMRGGMKTASGALVDEQSALKSSAVAACVRVISETVADLPCMTYERVDASSRDRRDSDPYAVTLRVAPNPEMTAFEYWENTTAYACLWGKGESYINRRRNGSLELWPLPPNRTELARAEVKSGAGGKPGVPGPVIGINVTLDNGEKRFIPARQVLGLRTLGYARETPIRRHREAIGLDIAQREYSARFYGQGASMGGFISMPVEATEPQANRTEARFRAKHEGLERAHLVGILEGGAQWQEVGINPRDAQYIEGREHSVEEIARMFRMPPHKIADLRRSTFSNIEHQAIEFVVDCIGPWLTRHEQVLRKDLYGTAKFGLPGDVWAEFLVDKLLRGDTDARYKAYALAVQWGWMTRNEVRSLENRKPIDGLDEPLTPLNMGLLGELDDEDPEAMRKLADLAALLSRSSAHSHRNGHSDRDPEYLAAQ